MPTDRRLARLVVVALMVAAGCGPQKPVYNAVSGTITWQGKPVLGVVNFYPVDGVFEPGTASGAAVIDGQFAIPAETGLKPGVYQVQVRLENPLSTSPDEFMGRTPPPGTSVLPAKYNEQSVLRAEVTADGPNRFDFQLE